MYLPPFDVFWKAIDQNKLEYDLTMFTPAEMRDCHNPFTSEQYDLLVMTSLTMMRTLLFQYHQWLAERLSEAPQSVPPARIADLAM